MDDASQITIGTLIIRQGSESDQPTAIFKDNDNVSGKLVDLLYAPPLRHVTSYCINRFQQHPVSICHLVEAKR